MVGLGAPFALCWCWSGSWQPRAALLGAGRHAGPVFSNAVCLRPPQGVDLDQLLDMSTDELVELFAARQRRRCATRPWTSCAAARLLAAYLTCGRTGLTKQWTMSSRDSSHDN